LGKLALEQYVARSLEGCRADMAPTVGLGCLCGAGWPGIRCGFAR
jgi:hypothetical protein